MKVILVVLVFTYRGKDNKRFLEGWKLLSIFVRIFLLLLLFVFSSCATLHSPQCNCHD